MSVIIAICVQSRIACCVQRWHDVQLTRCDETMDSHCTYHACFPVPRGSYVETPPESEDYRGIADVVTNAMIQISQMSYSD